jgi:hypothetical protein
MCTEFPGSASHGCFRRYKVQSSRWPVSTIPPKYTSAHLGICILWEAGKPEIQADTAGKPEGSHTPPRPAQNAGRHLNISLGLKFKVLDNPLLCPSLSPVALRSGVLFSPHLLRTTPVSVRPHHFLFELGRAKYALSLFLSEGMPSMPCHSF